MINLLDNESGSKKTLNLHSRERFRSDDIETVKFTLFR